MQLSRSSAFQVGTDDQAACGAISMLKRELSCGLGCCFCVCSFYSEEAAAHMRVAAFVAGLLCSFKFSPEAEAACLSLHLFPS